MLINERLAQLEIELIEVNRDKARLLAEKEMLLKRLKDSDDAELKNEVSVYRLKTSAVAQRMKLLADEIAKN